MAQELYAAPNIKFYASYGTNYYGADYLADPNGLEAVAEGSQTIVKFQPDSREANASLIEDASYATCANGDFTILKHGIYSITANVSLTINSDITYLVQINNLSSRTGNNRAVADAQGRFVRAGGGAENTRVSVSWTGLLSPGDVISVGYLNVEAGGNPVVVNRASYAVLSMLF